MKTHCALSMVMLLAVGCAHYPEAREYYPNLLFGNEQTRHDFKADWYGSHLHAMQEPNFQAILRANANKLARFRGNTDRPSLLHSYRFLYLPTFSAPILFRLDIDENGKAIFTTKCTNGQGGYGAGRLVSCVTTSVTTEQLSYFRQLIKDLDLKNLPVEVPEMFGLDGSEWILEVADGTDYHLITRWCARQTAAEEIGRMDNNGKETIITLREMVHKGLPDFDIDGYFMSTQRLVKIVDFMLMLSPLKNDKDLNIY